MAEAETLLNLEELLAPIPGDSPCGEDLNHSPLFDKIEECRKTDDPQGMVAEEVGQLREGQARVADWAKAAALCEDALRTKSKDLGLAVYLTESLARQHGLPALLEGLGLLEGLIGQYWAELHPHIEDDDLEPRATWLDRFDRLMAKVLLDLDLALPLDGVTHVYWEWKQVERLMEDTAQAEQEERDSVLARRQELERAVARTPRSFYDARMQVEQQCEEKIETLRSLVDEKFRSEAGFANLEDPPPGFSELRQGLEGLRYKLADILKTKPAPPTPLTPGEEPAPAEEAAASGDSYSGVGAFGGTLKSRRDALYQLQQIAAFFQRTEPHSPISYLVQRAARWGELSLESWLNEVIKDEAVLAKLRDTLGIVHEES